MTVPRFSFDSDLNGYVSSQIVVEKPVTVHIELSRRAPVVLLRRELDGEFANYGQPAQRSDRYEIKVSVKRPQVLKLATPVPVKKCYILN